jgi:protein-L-isoaspartate(D-aspartate) O-methyltransferase
MLIAPVMVSDDRVIACVMTRWSKTGSRFDREDLFDAPYLPIVPQMAQAL